MSKEFKEAEGLSKVAQFHRLFDMPILSSPSLPDAKRCKLRVNLLQEELEELKEAIDNKDLVEVADALCDLQYVLSGAILEFGMASVFGELFDEVHDSNMSKACKTQEEAQKTVDHYQREKNEEGHIVSKNDKYLVYRTTDNKVLKSINYRPVDLSSKILDL